MYEQSEISVIRRILWAVATFATIFLVLWGLVWVLFLRHSTPAAKPKTTMGSSHAQKQTSSSDSSHSTAQPTSNSGTPNSGTTGPTELVNTGAGDVLGLFVVVSVVSGVAYQIRLRTRLAV